MAEKYNFNQNDSDANDDIAYIYNEVTKAIRKGLPLAAFDIDTLIDVHDYAYDIHDDFVADELMTNVLTRSPRCLPMLERKAMAYMRMGDIMAAQTVAARLPKHSFVFKLITAQSVWNSDNWKECYKELLRGVKQNSIDDFGAVSIIDFALDNDDVAHIVDIFPELLPLMRYPEDFLYDLSNTLADDNKFEEAARALQELTTIQSFNIDYWLQLADIYINRLDNYDEGRNAVDYALAISPQSAKGLLLQGELLMKTDGSAQKIIEITDRLIADDSVKAQAYFLRAGVYIRENNVREAISSLDLCFDDAADKLGHIMLIMSLTGGAIDSEHLERLKEVIIATDDAALESWLLQCRNVLEPQKFGIILSAIDETGRSVSDEVFDMILFRYYVEEEYDKVISKYESRYKDVPAIGACYVYIFSLIRTGYPDKEHLIDIIDAILSKAVEVQNPTATEAMTLVEALKTGMWVKAYLGNTDGSNYNLDALADIDFFASFGAEVN